MNKKESFPPWLLLLFLAAALSGLAAIGVITGAISPSQKNAGSKGAAGLFQGLSKEPEIEARMRSGASGTQAAPDSTLQARAGRPAGPTVVFSSRAAAGVPQASAEEQALRERLGRWDQDKARELGDRGPMLQALEKIAAYPKLIKFLLDNELVVGFFAKGALKQPHCRSGRALADFLTDVRNPRGISSYLRGLGIALDHPGALEAVLGSRTTTEILTSCPAFVEFSHDGALVSSVMMKNERFRQFAFDGRVIQAITGQSVCAQLYTDVAALDKSLAPLGAALPAAK